MLVICLGAFIATVFVTPMSKLFILIAVGIGLIGSLILMEELTGGNRLSWLFVPLIILGDNIAKDVSFDVRTRGESWALSLQFVSLIILTEAIVLLVFRSRMERFVQSKGTQ